MIQTRRENGRASRISYDLDAVGYVHGSAKGDTDDGYVVDSAGHKIALPRGRSDAGLAPHHVERSKLFVLDRLATVEGT